MLDGRRSFSDQLVAALEGNWRAIARPNQLPPAGEWRIWMLLAGRGFGKTRTGAEWVCEQAESGRVSRIALVAPTASDAREVMVEGESGVLAVSPSWSRPVYEPSRRRLTWPNGAIGTTYSADEPERFRGPQHDAAWADELGAWRYPESWDLLMFGLRLGKNPRAVVTTTPKPVRLIRELLAREGKDVVVTRGRTEDNRANLAAGFLEQIVGRYAGTRLGRQELDGEMLDDAPGALWNRDAIENTRLKAAPELRRIVVAIDPAVTSGDEADETGIIVAGVDGLGHGYILEDLSGRFAPIEWARAAIAAYRRHHADRIVGEVNNGGEMIESTLRMVDPNVSFKAVHASRGKVTRAEPVSALYEQNRIHHVGTFPALEDQQCAFTADFDRAKAGFSPDRLDALVWALTELVVTGSNAEAWLAHFDRLIAEQRGEPIAPLTVPPPLFAPGQQKPDLPARMRAPGPFMNFAPRGGRRYCSDGESIIADVDLRDVDDMKAAGCVIEAPEPPTAEKEATCNASPSSSQP